MVIPDFPFVLACKSIVRVLLPLSVLVPLIPPEPFQCVIRRFYRRPASSSRLRSFVIGMWGVLGSRERIRRAFDHLGFVAPAILVRRKRLYNMLLLPSPSI